MGRRIRRLLLAAAVMALTGALPATAGPALTFSYGHASIDESLTPGGSYTLPTIDVRNRGDQPVEVGVEVLTARGTPQDAGDWVSVAPTAASLAPGGATPLTLTVDVPADAPEGSRKLVVVAAPRLGSAEGATVNAGIGATFSFEVGPPSAWDRFAGWFRHNGPWTHATAGGAALGGGGWLWSRRWQLSVVRKG